MAALLLEGRGSVDAVNQKPEQEDPSVCEILEINNPKESC